MNQELIILPYDMKKDTDYCTKTARLLLSPHGNTFSVSPTFHVSRTSAACTPTTSAHKSTSAEPRDGTNSLSHKNSELAYDVEIFENPMAMETHAEAESNQHQWPIIATSYVLNTPSNIQQPTLHHSASELALPDPQDILVLKETYV